MTDLFSKDGPPAGSQAYQRQQEQEAYARKADPRQSHEAALRVDANVLEQLVYETLLANGPMTSKQIAGRCYRDKWSISPRMAPLERKGLVWRKAKDGREIVWEALPRYK